MPVATDEERESAFHHEIVEAGGTVSTDREEIKRIVGKTVLRTAEHILLFNKRMVSVSVEFDWRYQVKATLRVTRRQS